MRQGNESDKGDPQMKKAIIFGTNEVAALLHYHICHTTDVQVEAFVVDEAYKNADSFCNLPVYGYADSLKRFPSQEFGVYVSVGYSGMNTNRKKVTERILADGYYVLSYIHPSARIEAVSFGIGNIVFHNVYFDLFTKVGDGNLFFGPANISHDCYIGNYNLFAIESCICGHVTVGDYCFVGSNATVRESVRLADYTLVGAGAYIAQNTNPYDVVVPPQSVTLANKRSIDLI